MFREIFSGYFRDVFWVDLVMFSGCFGVVFWMIDLVMLSRGFGGVFWMFWGCL